MDAKSGDGFAVAVRYASFIAMKGKTMEITPEIR